MTYWDITHIVVPSFSNLAVCGLQAGYDTTSLTLAYALFLIGSHPAVEEELFDEVH